MYKISEFARLCGTTAKTLRFYDSVGILKADYTDPSSGYRYYNRSSQPAYYKITALKQIGFTIAEIKQQLVNTSDAQTLAILKDKAHKLLESYQNCRMTIEMYEERIKMYEELNVPRVKVDFDREKNALTLDDGKDFAEIKCRAGDLFSVHSVLCELFNVKGVVTLNVSDIREISQSSEPVIYIKTEASDEDTIVDAAEKAAVKLYASENINGIVLIFSLALETSLAQIDEACKPILNRLDPDVTILWGASFASEPGTCGVAILAFR